MMFRMRSCAVFLCGVILLPVLSCLRAEEEACPVPAEDSALWGKERDSLRLAVLPLPDPVPGTEHEDRILTVVLENRGASRPLSLYAPVSLFSLEFFPADAKEGTEACYSHSWNKGIGTGGSTSYDDTVLFLQNAAVVFRLSVRQLTVRLPEDRKNWGQCRLSCQIPGEKEPVTASSAFFPAQNLLTVSRPARESFGQHCPLEFYALPPGVRPGRLKELPALPPKMDQKLTGNGFQF